MKNKPMNEYPLIEIDSGIPLFFPYISEESKKEVIETLGTRWIGQGPKVEKFEKEIESRFLGECKAIGVGSGTDALHLAYLLADIKKGDEVLTPLFTCTATNIPLKYIGAEIKFIDIDQETMGISIDDLKSKISKRTKAVICIDYGGIPTDYDQVNKICKQNNAILISDAAHALGSKYKGNPVGSLADYTIFSFQAIKTITTGDGGLLAIKDRGKLEKAKRLRWFGIDRSAKQKGNWENDIKEIGYKYQLNDISAAIGIGNLRNLDLILEYRKKIFRKYCEGLKLNKRVRVVGESLPKNQENSAWLITIIVDKDREELVKKLRENNIESAQVHYRNDRYSIFGGRKEVYENMDKIEDKYLCLPIHHKVSEDDVEKICEVINSGW